MARKRKNKTPIENQQESQLEIKIEEKPTNLYKGDTPLQIACRAGNLEKVKEICTTEKPFLNYVNNVGNTALDIAIIKGHQDIINYLSNLK